MDRTVNMSITKDGVPLPPPSSDLDFLKNIIDLQAQHIKTLSERVDILSKRMDLASSSINDLQGDISQLSGYVEAVRIMGMK